MWSIPPKELHVLGLLLQKETSMKTRRQRKRGEKIGIRLHLEIPCFFSPQKEPHILGLFPTVSAKTALCTRKHGRK